MNPIILIVMYYVLFHPLFINGQEIELRFNTSVYQGTNDYYAHIGEDVVLTCIVRSAEAIVYYMDRGHYSNGNYEELVVNGAVRDLAIQPSKYSFQSNNGIYQLTIYNLEKSDSLPYRCEFCTEGSRGLLRCTTGPVVVQLDVKETNDDSQMPDFCDLINNTGGIFFTGNDLILRCPKLSFSLKASDGSSAVKVDFKMEEDGDIFTLLTVKDLTTKFNGTMLSCFSSQNDEIDYCRYFPTISVFHNITIMMSGGEDAISNGSNVAFTCHSHPFLPLTIQWDILDTNVRFENVSVSEIAQGSKITFRNVEFLDSTSSSLTVFCNVTIGSQSSFQKASAYLRIRDGATTHVTSVVSETGFTKFMKSTPTFKTRPTYVSPAIIAVPTGVVAFVALGFVIVGLIFIKVRNSEKKEELDRKKVNKRQDVKTLDQSSYFTVVNNETEIGLENYCAAHEKEKRQVEEDSYDDVDNNATMENDTAANFPSDGVYEKSLPATYVNGPFKRIPNFK